MIQASLEEGKKKRGAYKILSKYKEGNNSGRGKK